MTTWRVGRKLGRTLYRDEQLVGMVDSPEVAREIVEALNGGDRALEGLARLIDSQCPEPDEVHAGGHCDYRHAASMIRRYIEAGQRPESGRERSPEPVDGCECDRCAPPCTTPGCCGNPPSDP